MFRQDRTNPSTAVSNWKGRTHTPKAWASTAVSTWLNGGLFGGDFTITQTGGSYYESGGNTYVVFTGSGSITTTAAHALDILVCGGGGSGGYGTGAWSGWGVTYRGGPGGGGAGGANVQSGYTLPAGTHTIACGAGGAGVTSWSTNSNGYGNSGNDSTLTLSNGTVITGNGGGSGAGTGYGTTGGSGAVSYTHLTLPTILLV